MIVCSASVPGGLAQRIIERPGDQLAGRLQPVLREPGLQRRDRRPLDADLHVAPLAGIPRVAAPVVGDAGAAGERDPAVDDQRLAVGAVVVAAEAAPAESGCTRPAGSVPPSRILRIVFADRRRADRVEEDLDPHAGLRLRRERFRELAADLPVPVDVGLDGDRRLGLGDRLQHRRIEGVAVVQDVERVPRQERHPGRARHRRQELLVVDRELVVEAVLRRGLDRRDQVADQRHEAHADRPAPFVVRQVPEKGQRPRPPRPEQPARPGPERQHAFRLPLQRIRRQFVAPAVGEPGAAQAVEAAASAGIRAAAPPPAATIAVGTRACSGATGEAIAGSVMQPARRPAEMGSGPDLLFRAMSRRLFVRVRSEPA